MLGKAPHATFTQYINALRGIRYEMKIARSMSWLFKTHKTQGSIGRGRGNSSHGRGHANQYHICGRNNHTAISCF